MSIPEKLIEVRERYGYTRKRLAEELGKPYTTITKYENGEREAGSEYLIEIAKKFHVSTDYLLGLETEKSPEPEATGLGEITREMSIELLKALGLLDQSGNLSDDDLAFLAHIVGLLEWRFGNRS